MSGTETLNRIEALGITQLSDEILDELQEGVDALENARFRPPTNKFHDMVRDLRVVYGYFQSEEGQKMVHLASYLLGGDITAEEVRERLKGMEQP